MGETSALLQYLIHRRTDRCSLLEESTVLSLCFLLTSCFNHHLFLFCSSAFPALLSCVLVLIRPGERRYGVRHVDDPTFFVSSVTDAEAPRTRCIGKEIWVLANGNSVTGTACAQWIRHVSLYTMSVQSFPSSPLVDIPCIKIDGQPGRPIENSSVSRHLQGRKVSDWLHFYSRAPSMNRSCKGIDVWSLPGRKRTRIQRKMGGLGGNKRRAAGNNFFFLFCFLFFLRLPHSLRVTTNALTRR